MSVNNDMDLLSASSVTRNVAVTFDFINNDIDDTFTIRFTQPGTYPDGMECVYQGAAPKCLDFIWYQTPDTNDVATAAQPQSIKSFEITSINTGRTDDCNKPGTENGAQCVSNHEMDSGMHSIVVGNDNNWETHSSGDKAEECAADTLTTGVGENDYGNKIGTQCCTLDGSSGYRQNLPGGINYSGYKGCLNGITYDVAKAACEQTGGRLCTAEEVTNNVGSATGCNHDAYHVWTSTSCGDEQIIQGDGLAELESVEFTLDNTFTGDYQSQSLHDVLLYFNGKMYECSLTPNGADQFLCALDCSSSVIPCSTMTLIGNDCINDRSIKLVISNPSDDYAVFTAFKIITTSSIYYGAESFCGTGLPHNFEIDGTLYADFLIDGSSVCGQGLLSNYNNVCVGNGAECLPSTLVIEFDSNTPNEDIEYALIEDDSNLNVDSSTCCNIDTECCDDSQCCSGSICGDSGKCEQVPTTVIDECREGPSSTEKPATVWGDPHYISFTGNKFNFQGAGCYYYMTQCPTTPGDNGRKLSFNLRGMHWQCNSRAKCVEKVFVDIIGTDDTIIETIDIGDTERTADISKDINSNGLIGEYTLSKMDNTNSRIFILNTNSGDTNLCGHDLKFKIKFVPYKGGEYINLYVDDSECFKCDTCGLFSIYSPTSDGEYLLGGIDKENVELTRNTNEFGYSWFYGNDCSVPTIDFTTEEPIDVIEECQDDIVEVGEKCDSLFAEFDECCNSNPDFDGCDEIIDSCEYDTCAALIDDDTLTPQQAVNLFARPDLEWICESPEAPSDNPTSTTPSPTVNTPSPTGDTPAPTGDTPSPTDDTPSPTDSTPSPTNNTPSPTSAPIVKRCNNDLSYNYVFLFDESQSVKEADYVSSIEFVERIINDKINDISKFGALGFGHSNDEVYSFMNHQQFDNKQGINDALEQEKLDWDNQLGTDTKNAIIAGIEQYENSGFTENNVLMLVTDGKPFCTNADKNNGCSTNICGDADLLDRITNSNIRVLILGITAGFDPNKLSCLVENEFTDIYVVQDYSEESLNNAFIQFESVICPPKTCDCDEQTVETLPIPMEAKQDPFNYNNNNNGIAMEIGKETEMIIELNDEINSLQFELKIMHYTMMLIIIINLSFCICTFITKIQRKTNNKENKKYSFIPQRIIHVENDESDTTDDDEEH